MGIKENQKADSKTVPAYMMEIPLSVTTSVQSFEVAPSGETINSILIESDQPLYISLGEDKITGHAGETDPYEQYKRLTHSGDGNGKLFIQEIEFDTIYVQSTGSATTATGTPGGRS